MWGLTIKNLLMNIFCEVSSLSATWCSFENLRGKRTGMNGAASERRDNTLKYRSDFHLKTKDMIWP